MRIYILLLSLIFISFTEVYSGGINLGPLYHTPINSKYEKEFTAFGPFIMFKKDIDHLEYGIRPFVHKT
ncbi:MAG: hypothetical protein V3U21_01475, partial [Thermodesulfobacteriota bacterium]